jgi:hypothetical protein
MKQAIILLCCCYATSLYADVYKWTDAQGNTHYGDRPPSTESATRLNSQGTTVKTKVDEARAETREKLLQSMQEDRLEKKEKRQKKRAKAKQDRARCNALRDKMRRMRSATGVYQLDKNGERVFFSNEQRSKAEANIKKRMRKVCH